MFTLDEHSPLPLYAQLSGQIRQAIARGSLVPEVQLPTIRELGVQLRINPNTVVRVYADLQREGLIATQRGRGTFVKQAPAAPPPADRAARLEAVIEAALGEAALLGISPREFFGYLQYHLRRRPN